MRRQSKKFFPSLSIIVNVVCFIFAFIFSHNIAVKRSYSTTGQNFMFIFKFLTNYLDIKNLREKLLCISFLLKNKNFNKKNFLKIFSQKENVFIS